MLFNGIFRVHIGGSDGDTAFGHKCVSAAASLPFAGNHDPDATLGGGDDVPGPLYGALFLVLLQELLWANWPEVYMILLGALLVGFVLGAPDGIQGRITHLRRRLGA